MMKFVCLMVIMAACTVPPLQAGEQKPPLTSDHAKPRGNTVTFVSSTGERLTASYDMQADTVTLTLPDGATTRLPRAISGSGARYANDLMVFWEHQGTVSLWVNEKLIFTGVLAPP